MTTIIFECKEKLTEDIFDASFVALGTTTSNHTLKRHEAQLGHQQ
jgi:hypothetical protein